MRRPHLGKTFFFDVVENVMKKIKCKLSHGRDNIFQNLHWKHAVKCDRSNRIRSSLHTVGNPSIHIFELRCYDTSLWKVAIESKIFEISFQFRWQSRNFPRSSSAYCTGIKWIVWNEWISEAWTRTFSLKQNNRFRVVVDFFLCIYNDS